MITLVGVSVAVVVWLLLPSGQALVKNRAARFTVTRGPLPWRTKSGERRADAVVFAEVAALLRAGLPPSAAWQRATGVEVDSLGIPDQLQLSQRIAPGPAAAMVAAARLAARVGAPLALVLQTVGEALRDDAQMQADQKAALAGPQSTARVLLALPLLGLAIGWVLGANPIATLLGGGLGTASFMAGGLMLLVGRWWISRLVAAAAVAGN